MSCLLDTEWQYKGLQVVRIENELICVDVLPQVGAKIYNFVHKPSGKNLLWHNLHVAPAPCAFGARFDDLWSGGWDELIPNDVPVPFPNGDILPDHGEVWNQAAEWHVGGASKEAVTVTFVSYGRVLPTRFEKELSLRAGDPFLRVRYTYANLGPKPIQFLWNIHPALAVSGATRLDVPAGRGIVDGWNTELFDAGTEYEWPFATDRHGRQHDLRQVPDAAEAIADHHYFPTVKEGWYAATDRGERVGFGMVFPTAVLPHVWLFRTLGGWRGLNTLILEISTGYGTTDLLKAQAAGHCARVDAGQAVHAEVLAVAYAGVDSVARIDAGGQVRAGGE
jgi:hypothetical protein